MNRHLTTLTLAACCGSLLSLGAACRAGGTHVAAERWWKGNTHTHTLWSDGDGAPELVTSFYREQGYDFLVLSDHNVLSRGDKWFAIRDDAGSRLTSARVAQLQAKFGPDTVLVREREGRREMRLATLGELRARFEAPGEFLMIEGEEISDKVGALYVHVNALNLERPIAPQGGATVRAALEADLAQVVAQSAELSRPMLAHVNHPNFGWSLTWEDLARVSDEHFFEVYNGHPSVHNEGDATRPSTEEMWDLANTLRLRELGFAPLYGIASDDAHAYHEWGVGQVNPGRGWVMVRAAALDAEQLLAALHAGAFYATSGVVLRDVRCDGASYELTLDEQPGVSYSTRFIGVLRSGGERGIVLHESSDNPARYEFSGDELFVRAVVTSSRRHPNPYRAGDFESAWCQPVQPAAKTR